MSESTRVSQRSFRLANLFTRKESKKPKDSLGDQEMQEMGPASKLFSKPVIAEELPTQVLPGDRAEVFQQLTSRAVEQQHLSVAQLSRPVDPAYKFEICLKLVLLGDRESKDLLLTSRFDNTRAALQTMCTLGVEFKVQKIEDKDKIISLQLWNISSNPRFQDRNDYIYRGAGGGMVVYDVTNRESFTSAIGYINKMKQNGILNISLVGTNCDSVNRVVNKEEARSLAIEQDIPFTECVAGDVKAVNEAFDSLVKRGAEKALQ